MPFNALDSDPLGPANPIAPREPGSPLVFDMNGRWRVVPGVKNGVALSDNEIPYLNFQGGLPTAGEFGSKEEADQFAASLPKNYSVPIQRASQTAGPARPSQREPDPFQIVSGWYEDPGFSKVPDADKRLAIGQLFTEMAPERVRKELPGELFTKARDLFVDDMLNAHKPPPPSRGVVTDTLVSIGQGLVGVPSLLARAGAGADELGKYYGITEGTHAKAMRETADAIDKWSQEKLPVSKEAMEEGSFRKTWTQGISSTATSLGVSLPMAAVGGLGVIPLVGRGMGAAIGYIMGAPAFGMAQYDQALQDYKKAGLPAGEAHTAALFEGISETGTEALSDALGIVTMRMGGLVSKPVKDAARDATKRVIGNTVRGAMARGAGVAIAEEAGELTNAGIQAQVRKQYGDQYGMDTQDWWGGVESAFGPVTVSSMIFGALGGGYHKARGSRIVSLLENPGAKVEDRLSAVEQVTGELKRKDPILADVWQANATMAIADGQKISREVTDELITPEKRVAQFIDYYRSQLENGDLSEDDLRFNVSKMRPDSPRAQAIDTVLGREPTTEKPSPRYAGQPGDEEFRQAEPTPQTTPSTPQMRQNEIARQMGYEAPAGPTATPTPQAEINQRLIDQQFQEADPQQVATDWLVQPNKSIELGPQHRPPASILEDAKASVWKLLQSRPAARTAEARQALINQDFAPRTPQIAQQLIEQGQEPQTEIPTPATPAPPPPTSRFQGYEEGFRQTGAEGTQFLRDRPLSTAGQRTSQIPAPVRAPVREAPDKQRLIDSLTGSKVEDSALWAQWAAAYYAYQNDNGQYADTPTLIKAMRQDATDMGVPVTNQQIKTVAQEVVGDESTPLPTRHSGLDFETQEILRDKEKRKIYHETLASMGDEALAAYREIYPTGPIVLSSDRYPNSGVTITKSTKEPGRWQITNWDQDGFSGDHTAKSESDAVKDAYADGYRTPAKRKFTEISRDDRFLNGVAKNDEIQRAHQARMNELYKKEKEKERSGEVGPLYEVVKKSKGQDTYRISDAGWEALKKTPIAAKLRQATTRDTMGGAGQKRDLFYIGRGNDLRAIPDKAGFTTQNVLNALSGRAKEKTEPVATVVQEAPTPKAILSPTATLSELEVALSRPLKKIEVTVKYQTAKGRDVEVKQSAKEALTDIDDQLGLARKVLDCIRG